MSRDSKVDWMGIQHICKRGNLNSCIINIFFCVKVPVHTEFSSWGEGTQA